MENYLKNNTLNSLNKSLILSSNCKTRICIEWSLPNNIIRNLRYNNERLSWQIILNKNLWWNPWNKLFTKKLKNLHIIKINNKVFILNKKILINKIIMDDCAYLLKYIIVGDSSVGKSCFMLRFTDNRFKLDHDITIGVEFGTKVIKIGKNLIKIQIWDTAGQESFRSIARSYYRGAVGVLMMYDITNKDSFINIFRWLTEIKEMATNHVNITLIGNKLDLAEHRVVKTEEGK